MLTPMRLIKMLIRVILVMWMIRIVLNARCDTPEATVNLNLWDADEILTEEPTPDVDDAEPFHHEVGDMPYELTVQQYADKYGNGKPPTVYTWKRYGRVDYKQDVEGGAIRIADKPPGKMYQYWDS